MVKSNTTSITPARHADRHRHGAADPLTGDVRIDGINQCQTSATEVFNGNAPLAWTDLDLSAVIGANTTLVMLYVFNNNPTTNNGMAFRPKGNTYTCSPFGSSYNGANKCNLNDSTSNYEGAMVMAVTDANGIVEWIGQATLATVITLIGYATLS